MNERLLQRGLAVLIALAMLLTGVMVVLAQGGEPTRVLGGDEASLRALLARIAESYGPDGGSSEISVGQITDRLPFDLPLPDETRILGSVSDLSGGEPYHIQVLANSTLSPADVAAFYNSALTDEPWRNLSDLTGRSPGGFTTQQVEWANFCYGDVALGDAAMLQVSARLLEGAGTDIGYHIQLSPLPDLCAGITPAELAANPFGLLPSLYPPAGVTQSGSGASTGGSYHQRSVSSTALLEIEDVPDGGIDLAGLHAAYAAQLVDAGWESLGEEIGRHLAWSGWSITDDAGAIWEGTLTITTSVTRHDQAQIQLNLIQLPAS